MTHGRSCSRVRRPLASATGNAPKRTFRLAGAPTHPIPDRGARTGDVPARRRGDHGGRGVHPDSARMSPKAFPVLAAAVVAVAAFTLGEALAQTLGAHFERNPIRADETVRLIVETDAGAGGAQPDVEPLRRDFEVLGQSSSTQITIENGRRSTRTRWIFELAPRRTGRLTAGPLRVGAMTGPAIVLEVLPAPAANDASSARDVFIETDVVPEAVYVQSQLTYTIRIYRAAEFLEAALSDFAPEGAVTHRLGKDATYTRVIDGRRYRVIERRFAVFPQASGQLVLPAVRLDARIAEAGAASTMGRLFGEGRRVRLASQPAEVTVKPRPPAAATPWLPARAVTLAEEWPEDPPRLMVGEPVTWTLRLGATGLAGEQLPPIDLPDPGSVRVYPDQPSIVTRTGRDAVHGERVQRIAMVPGAAGELTLPELRVEWWDVEADAPRTARIPARTLTVAEAPAIGEPLRPALTDAPEADAAVPETAASDRRLWQGLSAALAVAWLATLMGLLRARGRLRRGGSAPPEPVSPGSPRNAAAARRRVLEASRAASPRAARDALLDWAGTAWPDSPPRDLVDLAARIRGGSGAGDPFVEAILALDHALWSAEAAGWTGESLAARLPREIGPPPERRRAASPGGLPSLHPA